MVALCQVGPDWYGILYSWSDNKKKSNLLLSIFQPGLYISSFFFMIVMKNPALQVSGQDGS